MASPASEWIHQSLNSFIKHSQEQKSRKKSRAHRARPAYSAGYSGGARATFSCSLEEKKIEPEGLYMSLDAEIQRARWRSQAARHHGHKRKQGTPGYQRSLGHHSPPAPRKRLSDNRWHEDDYVTRPSKRQQSKSADEPSQPEPAGPEQQGGRRSGAPLCSGLSGSALPALATKAKACSSALRRSAQQPSATRPTAPPTHSTATSSAGDQAPQPAAAAAHLQPQLQQSQPPAVQQPNISDTPEGNHTPFAPCGPSAPTASAPPAPSPAAPTLTPHATAAPTTGPSAATHSPNLEDTDMGQSSASPSLSFQGWACTPIRQPPPAFDDDEAHSPPRDDHVMTAAEYAEAAALATSTPVQRSPSPTRSETGSSIAQRQFRVLSIAARQQQKLATQHYLRLRLSKAAPPWPARASKGLRTPSSRDPRACTPPSLSRLNPSTSWLTELQAWQAANLPEAEAPPLSPQDAATLAAAAVAAAFGPAPAAKQLPSAKQLPRAAHNRPQATQGVPTTVNTAAATVVAPRAPAPAVVARAAAPTVVARVPAPAAMQPSQWGEVELHPAQDVADTAVSGTVGTCARALLRGHPRLKAAVSTAIAAATKLLQPANPQTLTHTTTLRPSTNRTSAHLSTSRPGQQPPPARPLHNPTSYPTQLLATALSTALASFVLTLCDDNDIDNAGELDHTTTGAYRQLSSRLLKRLKEVQAALATTGGAGQSIDWATDRLLWCVEMAAAPPGSPAAITLEDRFLLIVFALRLHA